MNIKFLSTFWGTERFGIDLDAFFEKVKTSGFDGIEGAPSRAEPEEMNKLCERYDLIFIPIVGGRTAEELSENIRKMVDYNPPEIITHPGLDAMSFDEGKKTFEMALKTEEEIGLPVGHEIHVNTLLYSPMPTREYFKEFPNLKANADFTNWSCVCPALFHRFKDYIDEVIERAIHFHARVSDFAHSLQIPDPRAPEYADLVELYEGWWDRILKNNADRGKETFYLCQEWCHDASFNGLPYTQQPVSDTWEISIWQNKRLKERWGKLYTV